MVSRNVASRLALLLFLATAGGLFWRATAAEDGPSPDQQPAKSRLVRSETLGGAERYLTHVSTDKPIYRVGEKVYLRGVILHHASRQPLATNNQPPAVVEIKGPKGDVVASGWAQAQDSVLGASWEIPTGQAGGEYTANVTYPGSGYAPGERTFDIRAYRAPRLKTQIKFLRDGYGPGDDVVATLHVERAEGGFPAGAKVTVIARVDGSEAFRGPASVDEQGDCAARFQLPADIRRGEGTLAMVVEDGGVVETASKTIPILLQTVDLTMYPEGGDLVAGLENRVYFEALTPAKKPADLAGHVIDEEHNVVAEFRSSHEGRGRFSFTPKAGGKYLLQITEPSGINTRYPLPEVKATGTVLSTKSDIFQAGSPIKLQLATTGSQPLTVTLSKSEVEVARTTLVDGLAGGTSQLTLSPPDSADGVLVATVWDQDGQPLAERLIFRQPAKSIRVQVTADSEQYTPGANGRLTVQTTDEAGKPVSAVVGLTVTDDSVLEMIEKREQAPRLPVMVLLEDEVRELADAHVYLDATNADAPLALDLLLGTQGWRRFALVNTAEFLQQHGDPARRVLALRLNSIRDEELWFQHGGIGGGAGAAVPPRAVAEAADLELADNPDASKPGSKPADEGAEQPQANNELAAAKKPQAAEAPAQLGADRPEQEESRLAKRESANRRELQRSLKQARKRNAKDDIAGGGKLRFHSRQIRNDFAMVRVYAHQVRGNRQAGQRVDFTETLFWHAGLRTGKDGKATFEFGLNDAVTSFRVFAEAFSESGAVGSAAMQIDSVEPFYLEPKLPLEVTQGDYLRVPIAVVNATDAPLDGASISIQADSPQIVDTALTRFTLPADARLRTMMNVRVGKFNGDVAFTLDGVAGPYADRVTRKMAVKPRGFPIEFGYGGLIQPNTTVSHEVTVPKDLVRGSLRGRAVVYPTPLASMTAALERLIREPGGCFEQTSSTVYPLVMAQQYFMSHQGVDPALIERSSGILERGYNRLIGFECKSGGFEWFGADPGHDALTAYGLLEFTDMAQVRHVDPAMLERTRTWLLAQRDGKGSFSRVTHTYHTWLPDPEISTSYNTWALLEAGVDADLATEVAWVREAAEKTDNTYVMALAANVLALAGDKEGENHLLDKLAGKQSADGSLQGATVSVVGSGGEALAIETTSLAVLAWLKNPHYASSVEKSIKFLAECCKGGRFGSTQSTVLALRAIVAYDQSRAKPKAPGSLQLLVDDQPVGDPVPFGVDTQGAIELPELGDALSPGKHTVAIRMSDGSPMPYSLAADFHSLKPDSSDDCKLHLQVDLRDRRIDEGAVTEAEVIVVNRTDEKVPCATAIVGIPGGLEVRHDQLKELVKEGQIAAYEVIGREVVLYWRVLQAEERVAVPISLVAAIPGTYTGPASRAYLYYTDEHKQWVDGFQLEVTPKLE